MVPHQPGFKKQMDPTIYFEVLVLIDVLLGDVFCDDIVRHVAGTATEIASCPLMVNAYASQGDHTARADVHLRVNLPSAPENAGEPSTLSTMRPGGACPTNANRFSPKLEERIPNCAAKSNPCWLRMPRVRE
jgi:hypothetical protein